MFTEPSSQNQIDQFINNLPNGMRLELCASYLAAKKKGDAAKQGGIALLFALEKGRLDVCRHLIHQGADLNITRRHSSVTPLDWTIKEKQVELVQTMLRKMGATALEDLNKKCEYLVFETPIVPEAETAAPPKDSDQNGSPRRALP